MNHLITAVVSLACWGTGFELLANSPSYAQGVSPKSEPTTALISTNNYLLIDRQTAAKTTLDIQVMLGRATSIDFTLSDETIQYILLGDSSRTVYTTDAPLDSGNATTIYLRPIEALNFPGATTADITNLYVNTIDSQGQIQNYAFNIVPAARNENYIGVRITSDTMVQPITISGRQVTADDVENGIQLAIAYGYTRADDPIVAKVEQMIELMRSGTPIRAAAQTADVSILVVTALARIALFPTLDASQLIEPVVNPLLQSMPV